jgi:phosphoadenosine phosphosulfate reductase
MSAIPVRLDRQATSTTNDDTAGYPRLAMLDSTVAEARTAASRGLPRPHAHFQRLEPTPQLLDELRAASESLESATPEEIIAWGVERYAPYLTMATAFGPEGCVILAMLAKIAPQTYVFNLETGYQFQETLDLRDKIADKYGIEVDLLQPELSVEEYEALHGGPLYRTNPNQCCHDRKIKTLERASKVMHAWMSGIRRDQSADRAQAAIVGWDKRFGLVKISPLANWTKKDVWKRIADEGIPYNPLHDQGYPSIGCWPCTRAVADGETDERAGRWSGMRKTECGLHSVNEQDGSGI